MVANLLVHLFLGSIISLSYPNSKEATEIDRRDRLTDIAAAVIGKQVAEKHHMRFGGIGGGSHTRAKGG